MAAVRVCLPYLLHLLLLIKFFAAKEHLITKSDAWCIGTPESQYCWVQDGIIHLFHIFTVSLCCLPTWQIALSVGAAHPGQVCVRMNSCRSVQGGLNALPPGCFGNPCTSESTLSWIFCVPSSLCKGGEPQGFKYPYFLFLWVILFLCYLC